MRACRLDCEQEMTGSTEMTTEAVNQPKLSRQEMKPFLERRNGPGLCRLVLLIAVISVTAAGITYAGDHPWLLLPALFMHGIVLAHLFSLQHESEHHTAFRSKWICDAVSFVCGFLILVPPRYFRHEHMAHHRYTNLPGKDPELIDVPRSRAAYVLYISSIGYWYALANALFRNAFGQFSDTESSFIPEGDKRRVQLEALVFLTGYATVAVVSVMASSSLVLWYWVLPLLLGQPVMRAIRMTEHVGRPQTKDRGTNTRTTLVSAPWRFLCWNMNYHAEHHFAPAVPFHALPTLHKRMSGSLYVEPAGYLAAHKDILTKIARPSAV